MTVNDDFTDRITISGFNINVIGTNTGYTGEIGEPNHAGISEILNSAWWSWTAPTSGEVVIDTFGSDYDTSLAVYTGDTLNSLVETASNDDFFNFQSLVAFQAVAGTTYQIAVDGFSNSTGNIALNLDLTPSNDNFANRIALTGFNISTTGTTVGFTGEVDEPNHASVSGTLNSAWWTWLAPTSGELTINTFGSDYDTSLALYAGDSLSNLVEVASNDDFGSLQSQITVNVVAGTTYQIAVDGFGNNTGNVELNLNLAPSNDDFANRIALNGFSISTKGSNIGFTGEFGEPDHAGISETLNSAWWTWLAPTSGQVTINTFGSDYDTSLAVYTGNQLSNLVEIASNDDFNSLQSQVTFTAVAGTTYQIAVDGFTNSVGNISLQLELDDVVPISNDDFADRAILSGSSISVTGSNIGFTGEAGEPNHAGISAPLNSAWWTWTAPDDGAVTIDTFGSDYDTSLAVYIGDSLGNLVPVASNDDAGSFQSLVSFDVVAGTTYQIAVDGFEGDVGNINLNLELSDIQIPTQTVDLILDFNGGLVQMDQGYDLPDDSFDRFDFAAFTPFDQSDGNPGNSNEQIFQILAGVREDFADFNVRVIWDDRGVDSPFFDNQDTVVMIVGDSGTAVGQGDIFGIAANVDVPQFTGVSLQSRRDTAFAFLPAHVDIGPNAYNEIRELIDTISHEAGHTFGLSHSNQQDSENRQIVTTAGQNQSLDSRFSPEILDHDSPEGGSAYAETERLNSAVGAATVLPGDTQSSQTLPLDPTTMFVGVVSSTDALTMGGAVDFLGDRDAFRFETVEAGQYMIQQIAIAGSLLSPVLTLWDAEGDFVALGSGGSSSTIVFNAEANTTYYAIAGSNVDRSISGTVLVGEIGGYSLQFGLA